MFEDVPTFKLKDLVGRTLLVYQYDDPEGGNVISAVDLKTEHVFVLEINPNEKRKNLELVVSPGKVKD